MPLPEPDSQALASSDRLRRHIASEIDQCGGWMAFGRFMELALYAPGMGYYTGGSRKFGSAGDFVTAPQISALFGTTICRQIDEIMTTTEPEILEFGAGTGRLAADVLGELDAIGRPPARYRILELSGELRQRQQATISKAVPHLSDRVEWLDHLPDSIAGALIANEVLDAMPVELVIWDHSNPLQRGVVRDARGWFEWHDRPLLDGTLLDSARALAVKHKIEHGFCIEIGLAAKSWLADVGRRIERGAMLLIDYGFPQAAYYHAQRSAGTLMCHYRHHAHDDPFFLPGLQDITAHVDFTAVAETLHESGLSILGYTAQAPFLMNCGILERLATREPGTREYIRDASAVQKLTSPAEMGELFKVIAAGRGIEHELVGFSRFDRLHTL